MLGKLRVIRQAVFMLCSLGAPQTGLPVDQATVPLLVEGNRPFIAIDFRRADGSTRSARFLVDSGGGGFLLAEPLARDVGLSWGETPREEGKEFAVAAGVLEAFVGGLRLELDPHRVLVVVGTDDILPEAAPGSAEGMLPGHVLARYYVVFDYPQARFTLAKPGVGSPKGTALPMPVGTRSGFPRTEIEVAGRTYGFLLDTAASFTMVSEALLKTWGDEHPERARHPGAFGEAKALGGQTLETMIVPGARWGGYELHDFGVTSQRAGTFERYMSSMMKEPIVDALAGNVLRQFRIELDYANEKLYASTP